MSVSTARWIGGFGALALGTLALDFFPPVGLLELIAAGMVILAGSPKAALVAIVPTCLVLASAVAVMVEVSGPGNPIMLPLAILAVLMMAALTRCAVARPAARRHVR